MQLRADCKKAQQEGLKKFEDDDFGTLKVTAYKNIRKCVVDSYNLYVPKAQNVEWDEKEDQALLEKWVHNSLEKQAKYDPMKLDIVDTEKYFDIPIEDDWAVYSATIGDTKHEGRLHIKGTMDLIVDRGDNLYEYLDYKTGRQQNYAKGRKLQYLDLFEDKQVLLYYLALCQLYPGKDFIMSLNYVNNDGILSVPMDSTHLAEAKKMLRKEYEKITKCYRPKMHDPKNNDWKCRICSFSKWNKKHRMTECQFYAKEIKDKGLYKAMIEHGNKDKLGKYGDGGGRST